ncbi:hypothetical protein JTE90_004217 [Oedothorax gibbosus]|uniref:Uncharacterized protein n=1 Tax=Oedothorax gibbosus TaxID=931172 RepID=A0AAV6TDC2_9ARAC|nr:hypothetical protein JTE90_004217 [Oedothorax gibbosus]
MSNCTRTCSLSDLKDSFLLTTYEDCQDKLTSKHTIQLRMLAQILKEIKLTFGQVSRLVHSHTPVNREVADILKPLVKQEQYQNALAQDFVENEKLVKIAKHLCKNDHTDVVHSVLAMDGMSGNKLSNGPTVDVKRYIENVKFSLSGCAGLYDREKEDELKRAHVFAVRQVYKALPSQAQRVNNVFHVLKKVLQEYTGEEWTVTSITHNLDESLLQKCVEIYKENMKDTDYRTMMKLLKAKTTQQGTTLAGASDEEDEEEEEVVVITKKRKRDDK